MQEDDDAFDHFLPLSHQRERLPASSLLLFLSSNCILFSFFPFGESVRMGISWCWRIPCDRLSELCSVLCTHTRIRHVSLLISISLSVLVSMWFYSYFTFILAPSSSISLHISLSPLPFYWCWMRLLPTFNITRRMKWMRIFFQEDDLIYYSLLLCLA